MPLLLAAAGSTAVALVVVYALCRAAQAGDEPRATVTRIHPSARNVRRITRPYDWSRDGDR